MQVASSQRKFTVLPGWAALWPLAAQSAPGMPAPDFWLWKAPTCTAVLVPMYSVASGRAEIV